MSKKPITIHPEEFASIKTIDVVIDKLTMNCLVQLTKIDCNKLDDNDKIKCYGRSLDLHDKCWQPRATFKQLLREINDIV